MDVIEIKKRPEWLKKKIDLAKCTELHRLFGKMKLNTVCKEAHCPNISECFSAKVATFLILGNICTRKCAFCAVRKGKPQPLDNHEPKRLVKAVKELGLKHVVITSVTRDDLPDGGAAVFVEDIKALKIMNADIKVEVLVPDFQGNINSIKEVILSGCDIFAHNIETVPDLYAQVRSDSDYQRSLKVLRTAKMINPNIYIKSGIMLGLGESEEQVLKALKDLKLAGCDFLSIGQYLAPSKKHFQVKEFIHPKKFNYYEKKAQDMGFLYVKSGSYVRSSYVAHEYLI